MKITHITLDELQEIEEMRRIKELKDLEERRSVKEFQNPFFVLVHTNGKIPKNLNKELVDRVERELIVIKQNYDYVEMNDWPPHKIPLGLPYNRPILVCGYFGSQCVKDQRDSLNRAGYQAHTSKEATF